MKRVSLIIGFWMLLIPVLPAQASVFSENFESGQGGWTAENGVWEVGEAGPDVCFDGTGCAGTNFSGNYPNDGTDSRLVSPSIVLPALAGVQQLHLRFREWHQYAVAFGEGDRGQVQLTVWDPVGLFWSAWQSIDQPVRASSGAWSVKDVDLTAYAGQKIRLAFYHIDDTYNGDYVRFGWYIDDLSIDIQSPPSVSDFGGDFEDGWGQWSADNGVWEVGLPSVGPGACHSGDSCAGTILDGNYPNTGTDSSLRGPELQLPTVTGYEEIHLRFWEWHQYAVAFGEDDRGQVRLSAWDPVGLTWLGWQDIGQPVRGSSAAWTMKDIDLTAYAGQKIRLVFYHIDATYNGDYVRFGWYIDDIQIVVPNSPPVIKSFSADPITGAPPLAVTFTCIAIDSDGTIAEYQWDYDNDGTIDQATTINKVTHIYDVPGTYHAKVTVMDSGGQTATSKEGQITVVDGTDLAGRFKELHWYDDANLVSFQFEVKNIGNQDAGSFVTDFYLSDDGKTLSTLIKRARKSGLAAGQSKIIDVDYTSTESIYGKYLVVKINKNKKVLDIFPTNNTVKAGIIISKPRWP